MNTPRAIDPRVTRRRLLQVGLVTATTAWMSGCSNSGEADDGSTTAVSDRSARSVIPEPAGLVRTSWSTDPQAFGAYSFLAVGSDPSMRDDLRRPIDRRIYVAGEATDATSPSTVHGALEAGRGAALAIDDDSDGAEMIVVVGAGAAGARAASLLTERGHAVVVVEARDRIGGRTDTVQPEGWAIPVERGANWVHDVDASDLADQLDRLGVATDPFAYDALILGRDGGRANGDEGADASGAIERAEEWASARDPDRSLATALADSGEGDGVDPEVLNQQLRSEVATEYGADAGELSAWWGRSEGTEGDDLLVTGGYGALVAAELDRVDVRLNAVVSTVALAEDGVTITLADGTSIAADRVVVTVPLGVLKAGSIEFDPPLPDRHAAAIDAIGMGLLDKVWLRWEEPWWSEEADQWNLVADSDEPYVEWFNLLPHTGEPVLLGLIGGQLAREWAERSDAEVVAASMRTLQAFADAGW